MKDTSEHIICVVGGAILGFLLGWAVFWKSGEPEMQKQAIHYNYGSYSKSGDFVWKVEVEQDIFLFSTCSVLDESWDRRNYSVEHKFDLEGYQGIC